MSRPRAERPPGRGESLVERHVAHDGHQGVVRHEPPIVERHEIVPRDPGDRRRCSRVGPPVRMAAEDQAIEDRIGQVVRIVVADLQGRQHLPALQRDLRRREGRVLHDVGGHAQGQIRLVPDHGAVHVRELVARPDADQASGRVDQIRNLHGGPCRGALGEERGHEARHTGTVRGLLQRARAHDHPVADRRLLVLRHDEHPQAVVQGPKFVRREGDAPGAERCRRCLTRPLARVEPAARARDSEREPGARHAPPEPAAHRAGSSGGGPGGSTVSSMRRSLVK